MVPRPPTLCPPPRTAISRFERARELYRVGDVGRAVAPRDDCGPLVDEAVVDAAGVVISGICRLEQSAGEGGGNLFEAGGD